MNGLYWIDRDYVAHSSGPWKKHKYIRKEGNDYIYSEEDQKHLDEKADEVIKGKYKNGEERRKALEAEGESYEAVQNVVNKKLGNNYRYEIKQDDSDDSDDSKKKSDSKSGGDSTIENYTRRKHEQYKKYYGTDKDSGSSSGGGSKKSGSGSSGSSKSSGSSSSSSESKSSSSSSNSSKKKTTSKKSSGSKKSSKSHKSHSSRNVDREGVMNWLYQFFR